MIQNINIPMYIQNVLIIFHLYMKSIITYINQKNLTTIFLNVFLK